MVNIEIFASKVAKSSRYAYICVKPLTKTMKRITALCSFAVIILSLMARASPRATQLTAQRPTLQLRRKVADMMSTAAIAAQAAVAQNVNAGDRFLVIRIRIPEK